MLARSPDVHFRATPQALVDQMLQLAQVREGDWVYDLGCGDGRIPIAAARDYGARALGVDLDPVCVREARAQARAAGVEHRVIIKQADIFRLDLSGADVVTLYLLSTLNARLLPQLCKLRPGAPIVSHDFPLNGYKSRQEMRLRHPDGSCSDLYLWVAPLPGHG